MSDHDDDNPVESAAFLYFIVYLLLHGGGLKLGEILSLYDKHEEEFYQVLLLTAPLSLSTMVVAFFFRYTEEKRTGSSFITFVCLGAAMLFGSTWLFSQVPALGIPTIPIHTWKGTPQNMLLLMLLNYYQLYQPYFFVVSLCSGAYLGWKLYPKFFELEPAIAWSGPAAADSSEAPKRKRVQRKRKSPPATVRKKRKPRESTE